MAKIGDREIETPECEKLGAVAEKSQKCGEFLDWLRDEKGFTLATRHEHDAGCTHDGMKVCGMFDGELFPVSVSMKNLLAEFFDIDLNKVESERRAILDAIREQNAA